jgi:hypothetical protein
VSSGFEEWTLNESSSPGVIDPSKEVTRSDPVLGTVVDAAIGEPCP